MITHIFLVNKFRCIYKLYYSVKFRLNPLLNKWKKPQKTRKNAEEPKPNFTPWKTRKIRKSVEEPKPNFTTTERHENFCPKISLLERSEA